MLDCLHGLYPPITEGMAASLQFRLHIETQNVLYEGDGKSNRLTRFTDVRLIRRMLRDARHRNHSPLLTLLHWHYVRAGELFSIIPLSGLADHVVNGGFPFDLPALRPFFIGTDGLLPRLEDFAPYAGFLDARIRYQRVKQLLERLGPQWTSVHSRNPTSLHARAGRCACLRRGKTEYGPAPSSASL